jgi:hypothetical protein
MHILELCKPLTNALYIVQLTPVCRILQNLGLIATESCRIPAESYRTLQNPAESKCIHRLDIYKKYFQYINTQLYHRISLWSAIEAEETAESLQNPGTSLQNPVETNTNYTDLCISIAMIHL